MTCVSSYVVVTTYIGTIPIRLGIGFRMWIGRDCGRYFRCLTGPINRFAIGHAPLTSQHSTTWIDVVTGRMLWNELSTMWLDESTDVLNRLATQCYSNRRLYMDDRSCPSPIIDDCTIFHPRYQSHHFLSTTGPVNRFCLLGWHCHHLSCHSRASYSNIVVCYVQTRITYTFGMFRVEMGQLSLIIIRQTIHPLNTTNKEPVKGDGDDPPPKPNLEG